MFAEFDSRRRFDQDLENVTSPYWFAEFDIWLVPGVGGAKGGGARALHTLNMDDALYVIGATGMVTSWGCSLELAI